MQKGYFISRIPILDWINNLLNISMTKIEQLGSGNVYCHLLDAAFPGKVPLKKVKWDAYLEVDFIYNFKILQVCFDRLGIEKIIDIPKLAKAKYQDNLQFIQWMKAFLETNIQEDYNALQRRMNNEIYLGFCEKNKLLSVSNKQNMIKSIGPSKTKHFMSSITEKQNQNMQSHLKSNKQITLNINKNKQKCLKAQSKLNISQSSCKNLKTTSFSFIKQKKKQPLRNIKNLSKKVDMSASYVIDQSDENQPEYF